MLANTEAPGKTREWTGVVCVVAERIALFHPSSCLPLRLSRAGSLSGRPGVPPEGDKRHQQGTHRTREKMVCVCWGWGGDEHYCATVSALTPTPAEQFQNTAGQKKVRLLFDPEGCAGGGDSILQRCSALIHSDCTELRYILAESRL